jgi:anti-sigma B factor antagonist
MELNSSKHGDINLVIVSGRLDANSSPELEKELVTLIDAGEKDFLVDLAELDYISSVGLRVFLMAAKKAKASNGKVALTSLREHVLEVFEIAGFTAIFPISANREEALENF